MIPINPILEVEEKEQELLGCLLHWIFQGGVRVGYPMSRVDDWDNGIKICAQFTYSLVHKGITENDMALRMCSLHK